MQSADTLEMFAELFVAFAGFTGLAGVLTSSREDAIRLVQEVRLLLEYSLISLVLAVLPLVLFHGGLSQESTWRVACTVSASETAAYYLWRFTSLRAWAPSVGPIWVFWATVVAEWLFALAMLASAAKPSFVSPSSLYLAHLLWALVGSALSFSRLVKPTWIALVGDDAV
jgi:hypothetical protein